MKNSSLCNRILPYILVIGSMLLFVFAGDRAVTVFSERTPLSGYKTVIIDAGHGGVDGGATSCTGVLESHVNLQIARKLDDLLHLLGIRTIMTRIDDRSIHTKGETIAAKKVSDLKERVRIINETDNSLLISIHQNYFSDNRYSGAQVFYAEATGSKELATQLQNRMIEALNPNSNRACKKADGIYLMEHINTCGILVECGFLSNPKEEAKLLSHEYQKQLCCVIASVINLHLNARNTIS